MRAQLLHLSGPRRGDTVTYAGENLLIGSDPDAQIAFPASAGVEPRHAEIVFERDGCAFLLRRLEGQVFVNHKEIEETILEPEDLLEFGVDGPRARFRIYAAIGSVCKPVRQMVGDARDVGRESGAYAFTRSITRDLLTHASLRLKIGFPLLVLAIVVPVAFLAGWFGGARPARSMTTQQREHNAAYDRALAELRAEVEAMRKARNTSTTDSELEVLRRESKAHAAVLARLAAEDQAVRRVHEELVRGVCLIHGIYGFKREREGETQWIESEDGERIEIEYLGSGFLASDRGEVITNRHVAQPWSSVPEQQRMITLGFVPTFLRFTAFFPTSLRADIDPSRTRVRTDDIDVAVVHVEVNGVPVLPLSARDPQELRGQRALVVGYPTGVGVLLAKADPALARDLTSADGGLSAIVDGLAAANAIEPVITHGALNTVLPTKLIYDAETTSGGSGGPVFGAEGNVIGVNFAILQGFSGTNFGVPIRYARELLEQ